ncbi:urease accessory protein [Arboricoccus pini]|uniref:Urease accessory protein UreE n=1 Tax=Arboricoccus pini TaxID=1963835 RepID=A0A212R2C3_9PROT|nr:urease accessory protein UreE [Arboricoccus pini]SNB66140.1 urease accessory protein [Arboricoccus pini]
MRRATHLTGDIEPSATVTLDHGARHRRRLRLTTDQGAEFLLDLPEARALREGDVLALDDGTAVRVRAAPEDVIEVALAEPLELARIAWHLGNRHTPVQILPGRLRLHPDHVLEAMLAGLGLICERHRAAFDPESGAYATHNHGRHDHDH